MAKILIIDDEQSMRDFLKILLIKDGYDVSTARDGEQALAMLLKASFDLVITDIRMPGMSGLDLLQQIKKMALELPVIMITAFASPNDAVHAIKKGAYDYISKPFNVEEIKSVILSALKKEHTVDKKTLKNLFPNIIGESREMVKIFDMIKKIAPTPANVLIYGESGTGKELVAQAIHAGSLVKNKPFVPITCSAIPEELMESELFGHIKGSFTGAIADKLGLFKEADSGTAFLDEIGELTPIIQTKLLRVLQEREIKPVGSTKNIRISVRIIAATNRILEDEILAGRFREDLFYRLAVVPLRVPSLRERKSDIPKLINHFLYKYSSLLGKEIREISPYGLEILMNYDFPGNVRELENIIERGVALETTNSISPESLSLTGSIRATRAAENARKNQFLAVASEEELFQRGLDDVIAALEKQLILFALEKAENSKTKAAELLSISFRSLRYKVDKYGL